MRSEYETPGKPLGAGLIVSSLTKIAANPKNIIYYITGSLNSKQPFLYKFVEYDGVS